MMKKPQNDTKGQCFAEAKGVESTVGPEWTALELVCLATEQDGGDRFATLLRSEGFHYGELIEQAIRHNLLPLIAHALQTGRSTGQIPETDSLGPCAPS